MPFRTAHTRRRLPCLRRSVRGEHGPLIARRNDGRVAHAEQDSRQRQHFPCSECKGNAIAVELDRPPNGTKAPSRLCHNHAVNAAQVMEVSSVLGQGRERRRLPPRLRAEQRRQGWRLLRSYVPEPRRSTEGPRWSFGAVPTKAGNAASDPADATKAGNLASDPPGPRPRRQGMRLPTCPGRGHEGREGGFRPCSHP